MAFSRGAKTFLGVCLFTAGIVWYVDYTEKDTHQRMRQGPQRDRERIEQKIKLMFREKLDEVEESQDQAK